MPHLHRPIPTQIKVDASEFVPEYKTPGAACADIRFNVRKTHGADEAVILPGRWEIFDAGFALSVPEGFKAVCALRSSIAKESLIIPNAPCQIDSDYRGNVKIILMNLGMKAFYVKHGERMAQIWIEPVHGFEFTRVFELSATERAEGGFGSTGKR